MPACKAFIGALFAFLLRQTGLETKLQRHIVLRQQSYICAHRHHTNTCTSALFEAKPLHHVVLRHQVALPSISTQPLLQGAVMDTLMSAYVLGSEEATGQKCEPDKVAASHQVCSTCRQPVVGRVIYGDVSWRCAPQDVLMLTRVPSFED
eukprot:scaffold156006_cov15-Tisochrysis_lutea.AAC.1